ncbi:Beta-catenin-like protein 1 [Hypsibius exemplaris]|uniref:Beta-catenin-like protein 1 n=1 Tax=Hypsibius exemplaris TaxID=2072580 RepID=A0A9X6NEK9_HYPEX|nr:Beta-catenin-like protein 1 [Hypsibius exemplaris]
MNVHDILGHKQVSQKKRQQNGSTDSDPADGMPPQKMRKPNGVFPGEERVGHGELPAGFFDAETQEALRRMESEPGAEPFDETALRKLINAFDKKVLKNREHRVKYSDDPTKFMDSEIELNDAIQEMHILATQPDLYPVLVQMNFISTIIQLLSHENSDISIATVDLLQELTDVDTLTESFEDASRLVDVLIKEQVVASLIQNMERLDETVKEEADGVHNTLSVLENILEFKPDSSDAVAKLGLLKWILKRLKLKMPFDANKLYASEILSILVQSNVETRRLLGEMDGVDVLLHQLAAFKRHDPPTGEEYEMMENLFNCLCSALLYSANRKLFLEGEGLQLMNLMLREKRQSRNSAIKVLDFALSNDEGAPLCNKFVEILGLRTIFPLFMQPPRQHKKRGLTQSEAEEHLCAIIASLARNTTGEPRQRFLGKFLETDLEKVERITELHFQYTEKVAEEDRLIALEKESVDDESDEDRQDEFDLRRLEKGGFTLQKIDAVILEVYSDADVEVRNRIDRILRMRGVPRESVVQSIKEYLAEISEEKDSDSFIPDPSRRRDLKRLTDLSQQFLLASTSS